MADIDSEVGPADRRHAHKLVERAEGIECCADVPPDLDLEAIAGLLDPRALGIRELNRLAHRLEKLAREEAFLDLGAISSATVARLIGDASADQLAGVMTLPTLRCWVLDEMFRRMGRYFRGDRGRRVDAVVHWRLTGGTGVDGYDWYETIIENGTCVVNAVKTRFPRVTITVNPANFLRLITGNATAAMLLMSGGLRVRGDLAFVAGLSDLFQPPAI
ncbi:MAG TPA: SCP2 sterol-binding domain-containing protein [Pseudonocardiaceae bacterium]